jgi:hypothetical protein
VKALLICAVVIGAARKGFETLLDFRHVAAGLFVIVLEKIFFWVCKRAYELFFVLSHATKKKTKAFPKIFLCY